MELMYLRRRALFNSLKLKTSTSGSFVTDVVAPLKKLLVSFVPKQNLNGYDKPWVGGNGKNCLDIDALFVAPQGTLYSGDTPYTFPHVLELALKPNTTYTVSSDYTIANKQRIVYVDTATAADAVYKANSVTKTTGSDGVLKIGFFDNRTGSEDFLNKTVYLQVEEGSTATAYAPYENICPISGHTEVDTEVCGKNLFDGVWESGVINTSTGENQASSASIRTKNHIPVVGGRTYSLSWKEPTSLYMLLFTYKRDGSFSRYIGARTTNPSLIPLNDDEAFIRFYTYNNTVEPTEMQIELGSTATDYEPYQGNTYTITLSKNIWNKNVRNGDVMINGLVPGQRYTASAKMINASTPTYCYVRRKLKTESEYTNVNEIIKNKTVKPVSFTVNGNYDYSIWCNAAYGNVTDVQIELGSVATEYEPYGTPVYGGTVDLISGEVVVDKGFAAFNGSETWTKNTRALNAFYVARPQGCKQATTMVSDKFVYVDNVQMLYNTYGTCYTGSSMNFSVNPATIGGDAIEDWQAWLADNPLQVVYELATPITYHLTPQEIETLKGQNNFIAEDGAEIAEITYWSH